MNENLDSNEENNIPEDIEEESEIDENPLLPENEVEEDDEEDDLEDTDEDDVDSVVGDATIEADDGSDS